MTDGRSKHAIFFILITILIDTIGFFMFAFATAGWMMFAGIFPFAWVGLAMPAIRGMMANLVPADAQGELQGATASVMSLTMIVSPISSRLGASS